MIELRLSRVSCRMVQRQGCTNFPPFWKSPQNSRRQRSYSEERSIQRVHQCWAALYNV